MDAPTLGQVFSRHLDFPRGGGARLAAESFAERIEQRHGFGAAGPDPQAWVEHFFEVEHSAETLARELQAVASAADETVLHFELGEFEYVLIDDEDEVVIVSNSGSVTVQKTQALASRLGSATLPAQQQLRPGAAFRPAGEHAWYVNRTGAVVSVDSKLVAEALRGAVVRSEPLARVAQARQRLAAFAPDERRAPPPASARSAQQAAQANAVSQVAKVAKADGKASSTQVVVVERGQVRTETGSAARHWVQLTSGLTSRLAGGHASAGAVAIGHQTFAVRAGGVTALVQKPASIPGARSTVLGERIAALSEQQSRLVRSALDERTTADGFWIRPHAAAFAPSVSPAAAPAAATVAVATMLRDAPPAPQAFNSAAYSDAYEGSAAAQSFVASSQPPAADEAPAPFDWARWALANAREARARARLEAAGTLDPVLPVRSAPVASSAVLSSRSAPVDSTAALASRSAPAPRSAVQPAALPPVPSSVQPSAHAAGVRHSYYPSEVAAPRARLAAGGAVALQGPLTNAGAIPATTLRALYTGLEKTARASGYRLPSVAVELERADAAGALPRIGDSRAIVRTVQVEVSPAAALRGDSAAPLLLSLPFRSGAGLSAGGDLQADLEQVLAHRLSRTAPGGEPGIPAAYARGEAAAPGAVGIDGGRVAAGGTSAAGAVAVGGLRSGHAIGGAAALQSPGLLNWAMSRAGEARASLLPGRLGAQLDLAPTVGAPARLSGLDAEPQHLALGEAAEPAPGRGAVSSVSAPRRFPSMFVSFLPRDAAGDWMLRDQPSGPPVTADRFQLDAVVARPAGGATATVAPKAGSATQVSARWLTPEGEERQVPLRLPAFALQNVNARRMPAEGAEATAPGGAVEGYDGIDAESQEIVIPVPLWTQMADADARTRAARAPELRFTEWSLGGSAPAPSAGGSVIDVPRPGSGFGSIAAAGGSVAASATAAAVSARGAQRSSPAPAGSGAPAGVSAATAAPAGGQGAPASRGFGLPAASAGIAAGASASFLASGGPQPLSHADVLAGATLAAPPQAAASVSNSAAAVTRGSMPASGLQSAPSAGASSRTSSSSYWPSESRPAASASPADHSTAAAHATNERSAPRSTWPSVLAAESRARATAGGAAAPRGYLRFRWPAIARWWNGSGATRGAGAAAGHLPAGSAAVSPAREVVALPEQGHALARGPEAGTASAAVPGRTPSAASTASAASAPAAAASVPAAALLGAVAARGTPTVRATPAAEGGQARLAPGEGEMAYVAVDSGGRAALVGAHGADALRRRGGGSTTLDMTVVSAVPPRAPTVDEMAAAGARPLAKGKKEGPAKGTAKTDALSLQGTVDSLAQRIYHRLKRRLMSDRERFGG